MKIIIASDTHLNNDCLYALQEKYKDAEMFIHCGDLEDDPDYYPGWIFVRGNNDYFGDFQETQIIPLPYHHQMLVVHSHKCFAFRKYSLAHDALVNDCDIVCYGHTHIADVCKEQGILLVNPGSVWYPRGKEPGSYAVMEIIGNKVKVDIIYNDGLEPWFE